MPVAVSSDHALKHNRVGDVMFGWCRPRLQPPPQTHLGRSMQICLSIQPQECTVSCTMVHACGAALVVLVCAHAHVDHTGTCCRSCKLKLPLVAAGGWRCAPMLHRHVLRTKVQVRVCEQALIGSSFPAALVGGCARSITMQPLIRSAPAAPAEGVKVQ